MRGGKRPGAGRPRKPKAERKETVRVSVDKKLMDRVDAERRGESRTHWVGAAIRAATQGGKNDAAIRSVRRAAERVLSEPTLGVSYFVGYLGDSIGLPEDEQQEIAALLVKAERDRNR